jgi:hypothetical protein
LGLGTEGGLAVSPRLSPVDYEQLISAIREVVHRVVPLNATVLVVSKGDDELLRLGPREAQHFPQDEDGKYAGYHPADSDAAIRMVEALRARGADYLVFPASGFWWLEHYADFKRYLESRYQVAESNENCWIVWLSEGTSVDADTSFMADAPAQADGAPPVRELIEALLPSQARIAFLVASDRDRRDLGGHEIWRMPSDSPSNSGDLMDSLDSLERSGIEFIVIPASAFDWLSEHGEVADRLRTRHRFVTRQEHLCEIYELQGPTQEPSAPVRVREEPVVERGEDRRSFGEKLRNVLFPARRNGRRP